MNTSNKLKNTPLVLLYLLIISFNNSCDSKPFGQQADSLFLETSQVNLLYDLKRPTDKYFLPYVLSEISGLAFKSPNKLLAVDDETGKVFEYDTDKREIIHSIEFARTADYEGVELVDDKVYVLRSDGDLFVFDYTEEKSIKSEKLENALGKHNDTEGLGYDNRTGSLLIACKEKGGIGDQKVKGRSIYSFNLKKSFLSEEPFFLIKYDEMARFWEKHKGNEYDAKRIKFKPSAIAWNPVDKHFYILSSIGKLLMVVNRNGTIKATYPISPRVLGQPEGLAFAPNGDMYVSSEGEGDRGYILKFPMIKK